MSNTGAPDLERSLITHQTPWSAQIANYKHYGVVTINSDPMRLLQQGTEAYAALEQVCIAQVTETKLLAAENKVLSNAVAQMQLLLPPSPPPPVTDITKLPKYKGSCHKELDGQCKGKNCPWLHRAQLKRFSAEEIAALPARYSEIGYV
ncbi:hypothetical protein HBI56_049850 [Parastagonospora nodorum]|uniref:Uncharacterized protein n=1 Tax=Phaeosphaeria nodorum (strain SN15 / ATCC MYA-4574 / FGSC 10173) TaxID=321614 RepID=A0A7U2ESN6_PHANO|nr:hypothetical protein HBH56_062780 [Parastagonospora nodorum]QRC92087.1 hypothetical protein JI435_301490 [Parastagonospora nodorum SN15]KAH3930769.1 hypothetical protein HBH54_106720 [Parastagonospora nodorum]KAH4017788.1 hypothetical protein HBI09_194330 [Parastagonospora nodorum]KAH4140818.1 hypothetical protein HBH45_074990 [Parastagonospora nodorum]